MNEESNAALTGSKGIQVESTVVPKVSQIYGNGIVLVTVAKNLDGSFRLDQYPPNGMVYVPWFRSEKDIAEYLNGFSLLTSNA